MKTCEERIDVMLARTMADLTEQWEVYNADPDLGTWVENDLALVYVGPDDQEEGYFLYPRARGGPSDEFRFYAKSGYRGWEVSRIEYWFLDWFDGASRDVTDSQTLSEIFDWFNEVGVCDNEFDKAEEV